ncbi:uncharacterized protein LOC109806903 [Cajanus cajan]|uniref:uncharacterized protein LOC109806903 n=1 Tax=Cajanus cajan TaxID=3821 RepID=UPI00098D9B2F|nr:uncharacterized protein LOC109806903 [Cajanus cajan]
MLVTRGVVVDWECFKRVFLEKYFLESVRHAKEAISEAWKCRKCVEGLKQELKRVVVPMAITEFPVLVEKAKVVEQLEGGIRVVKNVEGPAGSKKGGGQRKPYNRPQSQQGGPVTRKLTNTARGGNQSGGVTLRCYRCGGPHFIQDCHHTESRCFRCGQIGHESTSCPARARQTRGASRGLRLLVSTPASASVVASEMCVGCPLEVGERKYKVNLICLPLVDIDIILGMVWLSANHILIDCANRELVFPQVEDELLISAS